MANIETILNQRFAAAITAVLGDEYADADALIRPSTNPRFGDYQANAAMGLAKRAGRKPRDLAEQLLTSLKLDDLCDKTEIAGPGFINLTLNTDAVTNQIAATAADDRLGIAPAQTPQTVVVDYSGPNVAKEMHVGHLRSTVIGDAVARVLEYQGHRVTRQNHLGDWGTQFGMLIEHMIDEGAKPDVGSYKVRDLNELYQSAKKHFDADSDFAQRSRDRVVLLQSRDPDTLNLWNQLQTESYRHFNDIYRRMDVLLTESDVRGESAYNDSLPAIVADLGKADLLSESQGAAVVFPPGFKDRDDNPLPLIIRKSDSGYLYATTDLAAARYRINELNANRIIYVTDARQAQHFQMVFATLRLAGWAPQNVSLEHVPFGTVLGANKKPFKTRTGDTVKLVDLLDEAEKRAAEAVTTKNPDLTPEQRHAIAHTIGIGALKYADLSSDRIKDYVFDWDRMLAFEGNTAPYLQNAYVRIQSIFRKGQVDTGPLRTQPVTIGEPAERTLALKLLQFPSTVDAVAQSLEPHRLCTYLYELASAFHKFYESCPVLIAEDEPTRLSRLALCDLTARTLERGLNLLGINALDQM